MWHCPAPGSQTPSSAAGSAHMGQWQCLHPLPIPLVASHRYCWFITSVCSRSGDCAQCRGEIAAIFRCEQSDFLKYVPNFSIFPAPQGSLPSLAKSKILTGCELSLGPLHSWSSCGGSGDVREHTAASRLQLGGCSGLLPARVSSICYKKPQIVLIFNYVNFCAVILSLRAVLP